MSPWHRHGRRTALLAALALGSVAVVAAASLVAAAAQARPRVLILGDSISIGYTPIVQESMQDEAVVLRPMADADRPENCEGTTRGVEAVDRWLQIDGGRWDVIYFNFGLHDFKCVDPDTR